MKSIGEVLKLSAEFLEERKVDRPRRSAEELLAHLLGVRRLDLYMQFDRPLIESELASFREILKKRAKGEPAEYLMGEVEFLDCRIKINRSVLIPRPETEILADLSFKKMKSRDLAGKHLWDLCTGSGCLGIALKKKLPDLNLTLSDLSPEALAVARENAKLNGVEAAFELGDLLVPFKGRKADAVVCNPPYISEGEFLNLDPSVRDFEPRLALVGGERGTEYYERLNCELPLFLNPGALVFFEIGSMQAGAVKEIFSKGPWAEFEIQSDWAGHPRFFFLEKQ